MSKTPERARDELVADQLQLIESTPPTETGEFRLVGGELFARDSSGNFNLRSGGGLTESQHKVLDHLVHEVVESCYYEVTYSGSRVTAEIWWTDQSKTSKIRDIEYQYTGSRITTEIQRQYDASGVLVATLTITYTYQGSSVVSADYVYSEP